MEQINLFSLKPAVFLALCGLCAVFFVVQFFRCGGVYRLLTAIGFAGGFLILLCPNLQAFWYLCVFELLLLCAVGISALVRRIRIHKRPKNASAQMQKETMQMIPEPVLEEKEEPEELSKEHTLAVEAEIAEEKEASRIPPLSGSETSGHVESAGSTTPMESEPAAKQSASEFNPDAYLENLRDTLHDPRPPKLTDMDEESWELVLPDELQEILNLQDTDHAHFQEKSDGRPLLLTENHESPSPLFENRFSSVLEEKRFSSSSCRSLEPENYRKTTPENIRYSISEAQKQGALDFQPAPPVQEAKEPDPLPYLNYEPRQLAAPHIVILDQSTITNNDLSFAPLETLGSLTAYDNTRPEEVVERIGGTSILLTNKVRLTADILCQCKKLKYIGLFATGYNNIDIDCCKKLGITVCNAGEYSTMAVAQHTFALILHFFSHVDTYNHSVSRGDWKNALSFSYFLDTVSAAELAGKTIGIIGFGSIGKAVARIAAAFGMRVLVHTRTLPASYMYPYEFVGRETLFRQSDVISLHCPLTPQTEKMIDQSALAEMKPSAILINTSRGGVIDEKALASALSQGTLAGAGLDVLTAEPMAANSPLSGLPNCVITPHVAWAPLETRERLVQIVADNLRCWLEGRPQNVVV